MKGLAYLKSINWYLVCVAVLAMAILHICATLAIPSIAVAPAYSRLVPALPVHKMVVLAPLEPGNEPLPFLSPDMRYAMCRFETTSGLVAVKARLPEPGWSIGLYSRDGTSLYTGTVQDGRPTDISLRLVPPDDRFLGLTPEAKGTPTTGTGTISIATDAGIVIVRAPDKGYAYRSEIERDLKMASCAPVQF